MNLSIVSIYFVWLLFHDQDFDKPTLFHLSTYLLGTFVLYNVVSLLYRFPLFYYFFCILLNLQTSGLLLSESAELWWVVLLNLYHRIFNVKDVYRRRVEITCLVVFISELNLHCRKWHTHTYVQACLYQTLQQTDPYLIFGFNLDKFWR